MVKVISDKAQTQAVNDAQAAKLYAQLETVHGEVFQERGAKRVKAVDIACRMVDMGYSLRGAAKAAGKKPNNKLQRYFEVAKARLSEGDKAITPPEGFESWVDAIAAMPLEKMADHVRAVKAGQKEPIVFDGDKAVRAYLNASLGRIAALVAGESTGKTAGLTVGKAQLTAYLKAFISADYKVDGAKLDSLKLTAMPAPDAATVDGIREKLAASLAVEPATVEPVAVNE